MSKLIRTETFEVTRDEKPTSLEVTYIHPQDMIDAINKGEVNFDIPKYEDSKACSWYFEHWKKSLLRTLRFNVESINDKEISEDAPTRIALSALRHCFDKDEELQGLFWMSRAPEFKDPMNGTFGWWVYYNSNTNSIELRHYDTKEKAVETEAIFPEEKFEVEIDIPSGKMVFGYYDVFQVWQDRDLQREHNASYFDSDLETKNFFDLYSGKFNIAPFYTGYFDLYRKGKKRTKLEEISFISTMCREPKDLNKLSSIEHDKMTCFCDLEEMLEASSKKQTNLDGGDCEIDFDRETIIKASKEKSDYKRLDIIDVKPGRYRITLLRSEQEVYPDDVPKGEEEDYDCDYTYYGGIELIKPF